MPEPRHKSVSYATLVVHQQQQMLLRFPLPLQESKINGRTKQETALASVQLSKKFSGGSRQQLPG